MTIQRYAFNGGVISPSLKWRSDIAKYGYSCLDLDNFLVNPQGSVSTRPGSRSIARLDETRSNYRILTFPYDSDTSFQVIFKSGPGGSTYSQVEIWYNERLVTSILSSYDYEDIWDIQFFQSYDVLYMFHKDYPVMELRRDTSQSIDSAFSFAQHVFNGGPFELQNVDATKILTINPNQWVTSGVYNTGEVVSKGTTFELTGSAYNTFIRSNFTFGPEGGSVRIDTYGTTVTATTSVAAIAPGDSFTIEGLSALAGTWTVYFVDTSTNAITLNTGTTYTGGSYTNNYAGTNVNGESAYVQGDKFQFYTSTYDGNTADDPSTSLSGWVATDYATGEVTITANYDAFNLTDAGRKIRMNNQYSTTDKGVWATTDEGATTRVLPAYGTVTFKTEGGVWDGTAVLQQSVDGGTTWEDIGVIESYDGTANGVITREISTFGTLVRGYLRERGSATSDTGCVYYLEVVGNQYSYFTISEVNDVRTVTATIDNAIWSWLSTYRHALGTFCAVNGYPTCGSIFDERLVVAGVPSKPMNVYMSAINDFEDWILGTLETSSVSFSLPSSIRQAAKWMISKQELIIGTDGGEWTLGARGVDQALSSTNVRAKQHTSVGSKMIPALLSKEMIMYVERGGKSIRGMAYQFEQDGYTTTDLNILASHLTKDSEIKEIAYTSGSVPILWVLLEDGSLLSFSFERNENVSAWAKQDVSGTILSIAADVDDSLWLIVDRDGVPFLENISAGNYHIDSYQEYPTLSANQLYPLRSPDIQAWNSIWNNVDGLFGDGLFINALSGQTLRVFDGVNELESGVDFVKLDGPSGEFVYWLPETSGTYAKFSFKDLSGNIQSSGIDYVGYTAADGCTFEIFDWDETNDWDDYLVRDFPTNLVRGTDWFATDRGIGIVPNVALSALQVVDVTAGFAELDNNKDMEKLPITQLYSPGNDASDENKRFGLTQESYLKTTDMMANPQTGGPGSTAKASEVEIYVYDSRGGEVRFETDDGYEEVWQPILTIPRNVIMGEELPEQTDMKIVQINSGYQQKGLFLEIRSNNPMHMNIAHTALVAKRYK